MTVVFKSEIPVPVSRIALRVSLTNRSEIDCNLSATHVMFEITVTDWGGYFLF